MADVVGRQEVLDLVMQYCPDDDGSCSKAGSDIRELLDDIESIPAVESEHVRHGRWIKSDVYTFKKCSECGSVWDAALCDNIFFIYCPRCGSRNGGVDSAGSKTD